MSECADAQIGVLCYFNIHVSIFNEETLERKRLKTVKPLMGRGLY
jgi:hypothetical protein